jgi:hypothetical protein
MALGIEKTEACYSIFIVNGHFLRVIFWNFLISNRAFGASIYDLFSIIRRG